jgi:hypothetical protein
MSGVLAGADGSFSFANPAFLSGAGLAGGSGETLSEFSVI